MNGRIRENVWYLCPDGHGRLAPYSKYDAETEAPEPGKSGESILLRSFNNANPDSKLAWCFGCQAMVECKRVGEAEIWAMFLNRRGIKVRTQRLRELKIVPRKVVMLNRRRFIA